MDKTSIGVIFIVTGILYGSMVFDDVYDVTLGWLVKNGWLTPPPKPDKDDLRIVLGRKPTILLVSLILIGSGIFILWNRNS